MQQAIEQKSAEEERVYENYRRWGYLAANLDPIGFQGPFEHPELILNGEIAAEARKAYCGTIGVEFVHIDDSERRRWIAERLESTAPQPDRAFILDRLVRADLFEQVLQARYLGSKRFSLEGITALIPLLDRVLGRSGAGRWRADYPGHEPSRAPERDGAHRGTEGAADIFAGFEDVDPRSVLGGGDVKYHVGATANIATREGRKLNVHLVSNPSHLEAVDPVASAGRAPSRPRIGNAAARERILPIVLHGDAAFAGQGIWAETLNFADLEAYTVGGTIHVIVNNLIGFTTEPREFHSRVLPLRLAKRLAVPIFHVNGEDPDAVVRVGQMAVEYRNQFGSDVVIDLIGYRRHGHSEVDDPTITQPMLYARSRSIRRSGRFTRNKSERSRSER